MREGWRGVCFGEAAISLDSKRVPVRTSDRRPGLFPYWGASGIVDHVDDYIFDHPTLLVSEDGENLRTRKTPISFLVSGKYWVNNHAHVAIARDGFDLRFLYYAVTVADVSGFLTGSTQPKLTAAALGQVRIQAPGLAEQRRIAGVLGALDDLIETNERLAAHLERLLAAAFAMFRFDVEGEGAIEDFVELNPRAARPSGIAPYVDMAALPTSGSRINVIDWREPRGGARFVNGDTLMARITPCLENGKTAYVDCLSDDQVATGSTEFIVLRSRQGLPSSWPYFLARSQRFRRYAVRHMTGTSGRQRCSVDALRRYRIRVPSVGNLESFSLLAEPGMSAIRDLSLESDRLRRTRDELLPLLMSGAVSPGEVEVAS